MDIAVQSNFSNLKRLFEKNSIDVDVLLHETYKYLITSIFELLAVKMIDYNYKSKIRTRLRNSRNKILTVKNLVFETTHCKINDEEAKILYKYLYAYFTKLSTRNIYDKTYKENILYEQEEKCNICGKHIDLLNSELDHIIPWILVGDELGKENFQMLYTTCNKKKSKNISYNLKMLLINKNS